MRTIRLHSIKYYERVFCLAKKHWKSLIPLVFALWLLKLNSFRIVGIVNNLQTPNDYILNHFKTEDGLIRYDSREKLYPQPPISTKPLCPEIPPSLQGRYDRKYNDSLPPTWEQITQLNPKLRKGSGYSPVECQARHRVAIIIPLRNREMQLRTLLAHMHPLWQRHQIAYKVYVVTQSEGELFNRAKLLNVGFSEASKEADYDCYVFHDVDLLAEDDRCLYHCSMEHPRQIAKHIDKSFYKEQAYMLPCSPFSFFLRFVFYFGGVSMMSREQFLDVNGFSNLYWGWGGEDDDMYLRIWNRGYGITHPEDHVCRFHMIKHTHESSNAQNTGRLAMLYYATSRMDHEGLNTLRYKLLSYDVGKLYTNITVELGEPSIKLKNFNSGREEDASKCSQKMPWV